MNILIINASPIINGNISNMLRIYNEKLNKDIHVEELRIIDLNYRPCIGCMKCRDLSRCILPEDDAHLFGKKIQWADLIVIGAPVYWGNMPGNLKVLFDRNVFIFMKESKKGIPVKQLKGKMGIIFTSCTTPFPFDRIFKQSTGLLNSINEIFKYSGITTIGRIIYAGTKDKAGIPVSIQTKIKALSSKCNKLKV